MPDDISMNQGEGMLKSPQMMYTQPTSSLSTQTYVGTFCYMSPERLEGNIYSFPSDIWALGMIIYEMVMGQNPYPPTDKPIILNEMMKSQEAPHLDNL